MCKDLLLLTWLNLYVGHGDSYFLSHIFCIILLRRRHLSQRSNSLTADIQPDMFRIPESEIKDLSKADVITKAFAIIQCTWLVVQSVSRVAQGYAISLLELATLAFIFCAFVMHVFWWNKPFDVESRRIVKAIGPDIKVSARLSTPSMDDLTARNLTLASERVGDLSDDYFDGILNLLFGMDAENFPSISLYITSTAFVAIHLAAWNWEFPSTIVRSLWRWLNVSTLVASFTPWMTVFMLFLEPQQPTLNWLFNATLSCFGNAGILTYAILRLVVLGLTFYCLSSMPERAYATLDWLAWVPHFS